MLRLRRPLHIVTSVLSTRLSMRHEARTQSGGKSGHCEFAFAQHDGALRVRVRRQHWSSLCSLAAVEADPLRLQDILSDLDAVESYYVN